MQVFEHLCHLLTVAHTFKYTIRHLNIESPLPWPQEITIQAYKIMDHCFEFKGATVISCLYIKNMKKKDRETPKALTQLSWPYMFGCVCNYVSECVCCYHENS